MTHLLQELNASQQEAVLYDAGPSLVIAGAGSGKTRVLTYKVAHLLESGYKPWNILALTFTNKAAREMKSRIATLVNGGEANRLWMGTFHSIFLRILRTETRATGFSSSFTVYDAADSKSLIKSIIREMGLDDKVYKPELIQRHISSAKNHLLTPDSYMDNRDLMEALQDERIPETGGVYQRYWERCRLADVMDFDDLLLRTYILLHDHPDVLEKYRQLFQYVLVDEYQDTNYAQHRIVLMLAEQHRRVCVVGDDAQSIYSFRGAEIDNILLFPRIFPDARVFKLEQNYRSTRNIVRAAGSLIAKNKRQISKNVFSENPEGDKIELMQAYSDTEEGEMIVGKMRRLHQSRQVDWSEMAVLYRTNAQSRIFEETMRRKGVPYRVYGGLSFYQRKEIKDVIAYMRLIINPNDEEAFKRVVNYPARGIGSTTIGKITEAATKAGVSLWTVVEQCDQYQLSINKGTMAKLGNFRQLIQGFAEKLAEQNAYELGIRIVRETGIMDEIIADGSPEALVRKENIEELANGMNEFVAARREEGQEHVSLGDYLSEVALLTDQDTDQSGDDSKVTLMTIHAAKGLEFDTVFIVGLEENLFPSPMCAESPRGLEEERRLFYVAITRAGQRCFLSYAKSRFRYGKMEFGTPSRFLRDIDPAYLNADQSHQEAFASPASSVASWGRKPVFTAPRPAATAAYSTARATGPAVSTPPPPARLKRVSSLPVSTASQASTPSLSKGQTIEHERFGRGVVTDIEGTGLDAKATIDFTHAGVKKLLLRFARFKVV